MWKTALLTFSLVFFAELGDKTQLSTMMLAAQTKLPLGVFLGAASALVLSSLVGVLLGNWITKIMPLHVIRIGAGAAFIILGFVMLLGSRSR